MIKLIVCDFDGTILERSTQLIYPRVAEALRKAKATGIEFCAATGRNAPAARRILEGSKVEGWMIDLNGAELRDPQGQVRAVQALDKNLAQRLLPRLRHPEVLTTLYSGELKYTFLPIEEHYRRYFTVPGCGKTPQNTPLSQFEADYRQFERLEELTDPIFKIEMRSASLDALRQIRSQIEDIPQIALTSAFTHNLEVLPITRNKASALTQLQEILKLRKEEIAVFGDDLNDLCLFEQFPLSYAVANAKPEILARAHAVIGTCDQQGPADVITALFVE